MEPLLGLYLGHPQRLSSPCRSWLGCGNEFPSPVFPGLPAASDIPFSPATTWGGMCASCSVVSASLRPQGLQPSRLLCPWDSPGKNPGVRCHFLFQRIFPTQGLNLGLPQCRQTRYRLSHRVVFHVCIKRFNIFRVNIKNMINFFKIVVTYCAQNICKISWSKNQYLGVKSTFMCLFNV